MSMKRIVTTALLALAIVACGQKTEQQASQQPAATQKTQTVPATNTAPPRPAIKQSDARVWVDAVSAAKGSSGSFKVHYYGVEEAKAMVIPLSVPAGIKIDSVSYAGGMLAYISTRPVRIDNDNHQVLFTAIPTTEANIPAAEGLLATIHFTVGPDATSGVIEETFVPPGNYLTYVDTASVLVEPQFEAGKVTVQ
jgi:hypothetical protein